MSDEIVTRESILDLIREAEEVLTPRTAEKVIAAQRDVSPRSVSTPERARVMPAPRAIVSDSIASVVIQSPKKKLSTRTLSRTSTNSQSGSFLSLFRLMKFPEKFDCKFHFTILNACVRKLLLLHSISL